MQYADKAKVSPCFFFLGPLVSLPFFLLFGGQTLFRNLRKANYSDNERSPNSCGFINQPREKKLSESFFFPSPSASPPHSGSEIIPQLQPPLISPRKHHANEEQQAASSQTTPSFLAFQPFFCLLLPPLLLHPKGVMVSHVWMMRL